MEQQNITVACFQQNYCFPATNVVFSFDFQILHELIWIIMKNQHLVPKNNIFVENQQQLFYVAFSIKYRTRGKWWCFKSKSIRNLRCSKNLDFRQFLKMEFELHICCHGNDLSDITNWQHTAGGPLRWNFCLLRSGTLNFHLWRRFFSHFDNINSCWQQKQLLLILSKAEKNGHHKWKLTYETRESNILLPICYL